MAGTRSESARVLGTLNGYSVAAVSAAQYLLEWVAPFACRVGGVQAYATTAGTGVGNTVLDVLKDGSSIYTTAANRPTLAATSTGAFASSAPDARAVQAGDRIALQVSSISSTGHARLAFSVALERP